MTKKTEKPYNDKAVKDIEWDFNKVYSILSTLPTDVALEIHTHYFGICISLLELPPDLAKKINMDFHVEMIKKYFFKDNVKKD